MALPKKPLPLQQPPPEQLEEDESSSSEEESSSSEEEEESESEVEEKKEKPTSPQNQASQVTKKQPGIAEKQTIPPPPSPSVRQNHAQAKKPKITARHPNPPPATPTQRLPDNDDEGSESEDEGSPGSPSASDFTIKVNSPKKPTSKDTKPSLKRPSEPVPTKSDEKDLRRKKKPKTEEDSRKEKSVARVCGEEDEIRILNGLIDYQKQKGPDASADMGGFHPFVKGNLQAEITKTQLYEKVRRLKNKYFKNVERIEKGENVDFSKHEAQTFGLSKKIWGGGGMTSNGVDEKEKVKCKIDDGRLKKNSKVGIMEVSPQKQKKIEEKNVVLKTEENNIVLKAEVEDDDGDDGGDFEKKYPFTIQAYNSLGGLMRADQISFLKANLSVVGNGTSKEFEGKWKELLVEETEILLKKFQVFADHTKRVLDGIKK